MEFNSTYTGTHVFKYYTYTCNWMVYSTMINFSQITYVYLELIIVDLVYVLQRLWVFWVFNKYYFINQYKNCEKARVNVVTILQNFSFLYMYFETWRIPRNVLIKYPPLIKYEWHYLFEKWNYKSFWLGFLFQKD